jgi:hypothetical protein
MLKDMKTILWHKKSLKRKTKVKRRVWHRQKKVRKMKVKKQQKKIIKLKRMLINMLTGGTMRTKRKKQRLRMILPMLLKILKFIKK